MSILGKPLLPDGPGRVILNAPKYELSQRAKDQLEALERRQRRAIATARNFIFD